MRLRAFFLCGLSLSFVVAPATAAPLPECTIDFDGVCPDAQSVCGATFTGGQGCERADVLQQDLCVVADLGYHLLADVVDGDVVADTATIEFSGDVTALQIFFATHGSSGEIRFFDAEGIEVGDALRSLHCRSSHPDASILSFATPVRSMQVVADGAFASAWIDDLVVNPSTVAAGAATWTAIKARF